MDWTEWVDGAAFQTSTLASKNHVSWTNEMEEIVPTLPTGEAWRGRWHCLARLVPLVRSPGARGPRSLSSSHFHLMVTDTALMSEGDNTWELKITIAST